MEVLIRLGKKIIELSAGKVKERLERNHRVISALKEFNFELLVKDDFKSVYAHSLAEYGMDNKPGFVKFFALKKISEVNEKQLYDTDKPAFERIVTGMLHIGGITELKDGYNHFNDIEQQVTAFTLIYKEKINLTRTPKELESYNSDKKRDLQYADIWFELYKKSLPYQAEQYMIHLTKNFYDELYKKLELDRKENARLKDYFHKNFKKQDLYVDLNGETRTGKKEHPKKEELTARHDIINKQPKKEKEKEYEIIPYEPINNYITDWLNDDSRKFIAILGEYGTGKTTLCGFIAYQLATGRLNSKNKQLITDKKKRMPLLFPLRDLRQEQIKHYIISQTNDTFGIIDIKYNQFLQRLNDGEFILLFDAFDEMAAKTTEKGKRVNFDKIRKLIDHSPNSKVILTSRIEYFQSEEEKQYVLRNESSEIIYLKAFDEKQIDKFIQPRTVDPAAIKKLIKKTNGLDDIKHRAVLLDLIIKYLPEIASKKKPGEEVNSSELYKTAIEDELMRKIEECDLDPSEMEPRLEILQNISMAMFLGGEKMSMAIDDILDELQHNDFYKDKRLIELEKDLNAFLSFTFLLPEPNHRYRISHKSFRDYLVAQAMVKEINNRNTIHFGKASLTDEIIHFINEQAPDYNNLKTMAQEAKNPGEENKWQATNAVNILIKDNREALKGLQLQNCYFDGVKFHGCNLENTNFSSATLKGCYFWINIFKAILFETDFTGSEVNLSQNELKQLPHVKELRNLTELYLSNNQITDISPLKELKNLTRLYLYDNQLTDISPLKELKNLTELYLSDNQLTDISPLKALKNLAILGLSDNQLTDISPLKELKNLTALGLSNNQIFDAPLIEMNNLTKLLLYNNQLTDINPLKELKNLTELYLQDNQIKNISPLKELKNLTMLDLSDNQLTDISPLKELKNLTGLQNNPLTKEQVIGLIKALPGTKIVFF